MLGPSLGFILTISLNSAIPTLNFTGIKILQFYNIFDRLHFYVSVISNCTNLVKSKTDLWIIPMSFSNLIQFGPLDLREQGRSLFLQFYVKWNINKNKNILVNE